LHLLLSAKGRKCQGAIWLGARRGLRGGFIQGETKRNNSGLGDYNSETTPANNLGNRAEEKQDVSDGNAKVSGKMPETEVEE
jgi:hypothetical protein